MALRIVSRPRKRNSGLNAIIVDAASDEAALTAAQAESDQVTGDWNVSLLSSLIDSDNPARVYSKSGRGGGLVLNGEPRPGT